MDGRAPSQAALCCGTARVLAVAALLSVSLSITASVWAAVPETELGQKDAAIDGGPWRIRMAGTGDADGSRLAVAVRPVPLPIPRPATRPNEPLVAVVPLPVPRPEEDGPPAEMPAKSRPSEAFGPPAPLVEAPPPAPPEPDLVCGRLMTDGKVAAQRASPVSGPGGCGIATPVMLAAVVLRDGRHVELVPPALMRCDLAEVLADWIRNDIAPAAMAEGGITGIADAAAYVCRGRNGIAGARLSEHARGNAIDILAFRFAKRVVGLKGADALDMLGTIRASACARFSTVLGPGSDAFHATDLHLDLEHRRNAVRLCEWQIE